MQTISREKLAVTIHKILDAGLDLLGKNKFEPVDHAKLKTIRNLGSFVNAGVLLVQQETAMERIKVIRERMQQIGYAEPKGIT